MPTQDEIRQMDGVALARLAWDLGLASEDVEPDTAGLLYWYQDAQDQHRWKMWFPHDNLAQADAVFRQLRARGWSTFVIWALGDYGGYDGEVEACPPPSLMHRGSIMVSFATPDTEALALLRCACLAAASEGGDCWTQRRFAQWTGQP